MHTLRRAHSLKFTHTPYRNLKSLAVVYPADGNARLAHLGSAAVAHWQRARHRRWPGLLQVLIAFAVIGLFAFVLRWAFRHDSKDSLGFGVLDTATEAPSGEPDDFGLLSTVAVVETQDEATLSASGARRCRHPRDRQRHRRRTTSGAGLPRGDQPGAPRGRLVRLTSGRITSPLADVTAGSEVEGGFGGASTRFTVAPRRGGRRRSSDNRGRMVRVAYVGDPSAHSAAMTSPAPAGYRSPHRRRREPLAATDDGVLAVGPDLCAEPPHLLHEHEAAVEMFSVMIEGLLTTAERSPSGADPWKIREKAA